MKKAYEKEVTLIQNRHGLAEIREIEGEGRGLGAICEWKRVAARVMEGAESEETEWIEYMRECTVTHGIEGQTVDEGWGPWADALDLSLWWCTFTFYMTTVGASAAYVENIAKTTENIFCHGFAQDASIRPYKVLVTQLVSCLLVSPCFPTNKSFKLFANFNHNSIAHIPLPVFHRKEEVLEYLSLGCCDHLNNLSKKKPAGTGTIRVFKTLFAPLCGKEMIPQYLVQIVKSFFPDLQTAKSELTTWLENPLDKFPVTAGNVASLASDETFRCLLDVVEPCLEDTEPFYTVAACVLCFAAIPVPRGLSPSHAEAVCGTVATLISLYVPVRICAVFAALPRLPIQEWSAPLLPVVRYLLHHHSDAARAEEFLENEAIVNFVNARPAQLWDLAELLNPCKKQKG
eukprot:TRINITY_DN2761_c0_g1_i1.p1 TRINITY_DN2761_c0_g1~~TRINITY_DN2761_c0_g1_i1.p1  ORF type:complete len:423 (+),score=64.61 TRINITY_DN2761_c0_g1_i1:64-1269(+)